ncbi:MAG: ATP-binding protein [Cellvibrio sp.]|uniref:sensor histidine kinase n=1 Tax=Cellvibrio sp. TaxID=1965322 RepID=UPI0031A1B496
MLKRPITLFLRIFISFWLAVALILIFGAALTTWLYASRHHSLDNVQVLPLITEARQAAQNDGEDGLKKWRREKENYYGALQIFLIDNENLQDLEKRELSTRLVEMLKVYRGLTYEKPEYDIDGRWGWWDMPKINISNGKTYTIIFQPFDNSRLEIIALPYMPYFLLLISILISTPICWILARYISTPVRHLQEQARMLVEVGENTPVGEKFTSRSDELGGLARDFDHMVNRIHTLLAAKEELLRNVSHELRSPLARIDLALELARRKDQHMDLQLERIEQESAKLNSLIGEIIELSKSVDQSSSKHHQIDLIALLELVVDDANFEAQQYDTQVILQGAKNAFVQGDENELRKVFDNILRNAVSFTAPSTTIDVTIRQSSEQRKNGDYWVIDIADHGPGVREKELPQLFDPFFKAASNIPRNSSGLGLSISANIVAACKGWITARNRSNQADTENKTGLIVTVVLPVLTPDIH